MKQQEQQHLPADGMAPPPENPHVRERLHAELDLADELRALRTRFKAAQDSTTASMIEHGVQRQPS